MWQGQLWATGKRKSSPRNAHHWIIPSLILGQMDPHIINWVTKSVQVPREFELATGQIECDALDGWVIPNTLYCMWQSDRGMVGCFSRNSKRERAIWKFCKPFNVVFSTSELELVSVSSSFPFWFRTFMKIK